MLENDIPQQIESCKIVPVVTLERAEDALPLVHALVAGGLPIAEITLRTEAALDGIRATAAMPAALVGAGSVMNEVQCRDAIAAGAKFIVSPGLDEGVVTYCLSVGMPCFPGVSTATELQRAYNLGLRKVKFFPAEAAGGVAMLTAIAAPFPKMKFMPTGGITLENAGAYLQLPLVFAVGGSWMVKPDLFRDGDFGRVTEIAHLAVTRLS